MSDDNGKKGLLGILGRKKKEEDKGSGEEVDDDLEWPKGTMEAADRNIDKILKKYPLVIVDCWSRSCQPCRTVSPIIEKMAKVHQGKVLFCKLNVKHNMITPSKYKIKSVPTILIFKNGDLVDRFNGNTITRKKLERAIRKII